MRLFLQDPKEEVNLKPGESIARAARPHLVTNGGTNWPREDRVIGQNKLTAGGSLSG
jgi:hypothetical protein